MRTVRVASRHPNERCTTGPDAQQVTTYLRLLYVYKVASRSETCLLSRVLVVGGSHFFRHLQTSGRGPFSSSALEGSGSWKPRSGTAPGPSLNFAPQGAETDGTTCRNYCGQHSSTELSVFDECSKPSIKKKRDPVSHRV